MRRTLWASSIALMAATLPATAQSVDEQVIAQLRAQGYTEFEVRRTWLGRVRILASVGDEAREIIVHPSTGAVLYDSLAGVFATREAEDDGGDGEGEDNDGDDGEEDDDPESHDEEDEDAEDGNPEDDDDDGEDDEDDDDNGGDDEDDGGGDDGGDDD